ncbi:restriction endonuclease subunit S [Bifidobacterium adolescentis]|uniref:restriction endonuclease subunit S n=1 Tax=Bifidobacterium adolescentis TaxID=1680 RepID=UPI0004E5D723|nr:restriction endonuclease subunit S [Bifidobacterium adolescentis]AII76080.1 type I restriction-modification system [Bifidobacterium adolescentis]
MAEQHGKTLVPQIRFAGFTDPWEQRKLSDLTDRVSIQSSDSDLPQVEYEDIIPGEGTLNKDLRDKKGGKTGIKFYAGDVLYGKLRPYLMNWLYPQFNGVAVGDFWVLRATECDSSFLYRLVQTGSFQRLANVSSGSKMPRADWNLISQSFFAVPADHAEQKAIAKGLAELDTLITLHQRKYDKLCVLKKSMLDKMFPKGGSLYPEIRFAGFTDPWEQRKLSDLTDRVSIQSSDSDLPQVEYEDIIPGEGTLNKDLRDKKGGKTGIKFYAGDVLYGKLRPYLMNWLYPQFNGVAVGDFWVLRATECDSSFLYRLVQTGSFQRLANVSSGSKMPRADWNLISQSFFAVPADHAEQKAIAKGLAELDTLITLHQRKLELLRNIKKSMLDKMFV